MSVEQNIPAQLGFAPSFSGRSKASVVAERGPRKGKLRGYGSFARNLHTYATRIYKSAVGRKGQLTDKTSIGVILSLKKQRLVDAWYGLSFSMGAPSWDTATPVTPWNRLTGECLVFDIVLAKDESFFEAHNCITL